MHDHYNTTNYPIRVCAHGNWDIYRNATGYCVAIPNRRGRAFGCYASHFGSAEYVRTTLGIDPMSVGAEPANKAIDATAVAIAGAALCNLAGIAWSVSLFLV